MTKKIKFNKKFDFKYEYPESNKTNYQTKKSIIDIICPEHGYFKRSAQKHSEGRGCHKCKINFLIENNIMIGGYSLSLFEKRSYLKNLSSYLYFLKINDGKYYKIGISKNEIKNRIKNLKSEAKKFNEELKIEILFYEKNPLLLSFLKEQEILNKFQKYRIFRRWSTELFSKNIFPENSFTHIEINDF
jgi:protein-arginine kinase activator protein McsA